MTVDVLDTLPARWRVDRMMMGDRSRWGSVEVRGDDDGLLLLLGDADRPTLFGRGDPDRVAGLVDGLDLDGAAWMSVPRGCTPAPDALQRLGLVAFSTWDWLSTDAAPDVVPGEERVRRLDHVTDAAAIRACLRDSNPGTSADPAVPGELGWWGVEADGALVGVVGAAERAGLGDGLSWHVHGLGVLPGLRGTGTGTALAAVVTRAGLAAGADWVSLGMYASNDGARRIYRRLGFRTDAELTSFSPTGAGRPPA
ncbi:N-acetyltransferase [Cellulomonas sp. URHD0024]|uniref:GNAT family N-acetyltransferase n=1 Tax=Cellulomonas sp. URHD0024 TaxID=1302620 RepID=UPI00042992D7|nr:GNAT family N-acetyltransferase [Cellulomonas sp. URHD0024]